MGVEQEANTGLKQNRQRDQRAKRQTGAQAGEHTEAKAKAKPADEKKKRHVPALTEQAAKKHQKRNSHPNRKAAKHGDRLQTGNDTISKRLRLGNGGTKAQRRTRTKGKEQKKTEPRAAAVTDRILWHRNGNPLLKLHMVVSRGQGHNRMGNRYCHPVFAPSASII